MAFWGRELKLILRTVPGRDITQILMAKSSALTNHKRGVHERHQNSTLRSVVNIEVTRTISQATTYHVAKERVSSRYVVVFARVENAACPFALAVCSLGVAVQRV